LKIKFQFAWWLNLTLHLWMSTHLAIKTTHLYEKREEFLLCSSARFLVALSCETKHIDFTFNFKFLLWMMQGSLIIKREKNMHGREIKFITAIVLSSMHRIGCSSHSVSNFLMRKRSFIKPFTEKITYVHLINSYNNST